MSPTPQILAVIPIVPAGSDLGAALAFYTTKLGFTQVWLEGGMAGIRRGAAEVMLQQFDDRKFAENYMFRLRVENIEQLHDEYRLAGVEKLGSLEMKPWGVFEFHVIEPAGVCIHFFK